MPEILDASKLLETLTYDCDRMGRPEPVTRAQLLAAADAQIALIGKGVRRDITFACVRCGLPQSYRLWERFTNRTTDEIQERIGRECIGRVVSNPKLQAENGLHLSVNALSLVTRRNLDNSTARVLGCDWAVYGPLGDLGGGFDVLMDEPNSTKTLVSFPFAPIPVAAALYELLGGKGAPTL